MTAITVYLIPGNDSNADYPETEQTSIVTENVEEATNAYNYNTPNDQFFAPTEQPQIDSRFDYIHDTYSSGVQKKYFNQTFLLIIIFIRIIILK